MAGLSISYEKNSYLNEGTMTVGIDEVGRGSWAGPLVLAGAVITDPASYEKLSEITDSKSISKRKREQVFHKLTKQEDENLMRIKKISKSASQISEIGLKEAWDSSVSKIIEIFLDILPNKKIEFILDGHINPRNIISTKLRNYKNLKFSNIKKGDSKIYSIAAASIWAKVSRDMYMERISVDYPEYGFANNVGYGTKLHREALSEYGVTPEHRMNYAPVAKIKNQFNLL